MTVPKISIIILAFLGILVKMLNQEKKKDKVILYDTIIISKPPKRKLKFMREFSKVINIMITTIVEM